MIERLIRGFETMLDARIRDVQPLATESRNALARVTVECGAETRRAILKTYEPAGDPHWANRYRREEKTLTLLAGTAPPVAPRPLAGFLPAAGPAALLMEDAGERSLADALLADGPSGLWAEAARFLARLHAAMDGMRLPLRRTAAAISLDRINGPVLMQRMRIAGTRILGAPPESGVQREMRAVLAPLLVAPKAAIHNSMSPLNVVLGADGWRAIDWETLSVASVAWDWAELLRAPYHPPPFAESEALMMEAAGAGPQITRDLFRRAALSRHLDSMATVTQRRRRFEAQGQRERAAEYARRAGFYAEDIAHLSARLDVPARLAGWLCAVSEEAVR